jgi:probable HAF family extracellular repeat protein
VRSEADAVNNDGVVVGMVDGPNGSKIGPNAFVYEEGRLRLLDEGGPAFTAATAINDRGQVAGVLEKEEEPAPANADPVKGAR